jgi:16S rRNA processing protein RimM
VDTHVLLGHITAAYGVKGWVKVYSSTEPMDNIFNYKPWQVRLGGQWCTVELKHGKRHGKVLIAQLAGCQDRDQARHYCGADIAVDRLKLPLLEPGDYYWQQLIGLHVETAAGVKLGQVNHLIATGANDVLVVQGQADSIDFKQRLIPWLPDRVIVSTDVTAGVIRVDWDPEF